MISYYNGLIKQNVDQIPRYITNLYILQHFFSHTNINEPRRFEKNKIQNDDDNIKIQSI